MDCQLPLLVIDFPYLQSLDFEYVFFFAVHTKKRKKYEVLKVELKSQSGTRYGVN